MNDRKGISLTLETVVLLILAAVVLAALLGFFLGTFTPAQGEADALRVQVLACQKIIIKDSTCRDIDNFGEALEQLRKVCKRDRPACTPEGTGQTTDENCIRSCCRAFCPG